MNSSETINIATFNLKSDLLCFGKNHWRNRRDRAVAQLTELGADIMGVQELTPRMRIDLAKALPNIRLFGRGRTASFLNEHSDIAVRGGIKVNRHITFTLPSKWLSSMFPRICTVIELTLPQTQRRIRVFNTHLDVFSEAVRFIQLELICKHIKKLNEADPLPTLLMGDFNALPASKLIRRFREHGIAGVRMRELVSEGGTFHNFRSRNTSKRIDYIFASDEFIPLDVKIIKSNYGGYFPSDHYPVFATLCLKTRMAPCSKSERASHSHVEL